MRWVNTRSLCFANRMEFENYHPNLAHDFSATSSLRRRSVLFPPSSPPPLAPARGRRGAKRMAIGIGLAARGGRLEAGGGRREARGGNLFNLCEGVAIEFLVGESHAGDEVLVGSKVGRCRKRKFADAGDNVVLIDSVAGDTKATD